MKDICIFIQREAFTIVRIESHCLSLSLCLSQFIYDFTQFFNVIYNCGLNNLLKLILRMHVFITITISVGEYTATHSANA